MISEEEQKARDCLKLGSFLIDPEYLGAAAIEKFKERCRECWKQHGAHYPRWVMEKYAKKAKP